MTGPGASPESDPAVGKARLGIEPGDGEAYRIAEVVLGRPDVAALSPGPSGEIGSPRSGQSVPGVRLTGDRVELHVIVRYGQPIQAVADDIEQAVAALLGGRTLHIVIDDLVLPGEGLPSEMIASLSDQHPAELTSTDEQSASRPAK